MRDLLLRPVIAICGLMAILWATAAVRAYSKDSSLGNTAKAILSGDKFNSRQMESIKGRIVDTSDLREASAVSGAAVLRMFLLEDQLKSGNREVLVSDFERLQANVNDALARSPTDSFMWLEAFWLGRLRAKEVSARDADLLRMSYVFGPNEGWIVSKRIGLAFESFEKLPADVGELALSDFIRLIQSGFIWEAAGILEGPGWPIRNRLLARLTTVDLSARNTFAKALADKGIEGLVVPGVEHRPSRPY